MTEPGRLQLGKSVANVAAAEEDRELAVDQLTAAVSEDGWPIDPARSLLLAATGREPTDSAIVWEYGPADRLATLAREVCERGPYRMSGCRDMIRRLPSSTFGRIIPLEIGLKVRWTGPRHFA